MKTLSSKARHILKQMAQMSEGPDDAKWYAVTEVMKLLVDRPVSAMEIIEMADTENEDDRVLIDFSNKDVMFEENNMRLLLDDLVLRDYLERRELPGVQYRRLQKAKPWPIDDVREILKKRGARPVVSGLSEEGVVIVDQITASLLINIYDNLSAMNQAKFATRDVVEATRLAWRLVEKGTISVSLRSG